jgi:hypothetical protein
MEDVELVFHKIMHEVDMLRIAGQKEYVHDEGSAFRNLEAIASEADIPREKVWYVFAKKHIDGIVAWIRGHRSQRENVRGRINDLIMYLILLRAMIDENEQVQDAEAALDRREARINIQREDEYWACMTCTFKSARGADANNHAIETGHDVELRKGVA